MSYRSNLHISPLQNRTLPLHSTPKHAATTTLLSLCLALHLLANFDIDLEELGYAAVEADGFALVEVGFPVVCVYAFGCAGFDEAGVGGCVSVDLVQEGCRWWACRVVGWGIEQM